VPDGEVASQAGQCRLVEDLGHQAQVFVDDHAGAVADGDAGRLLTTVLEGEESEIRELGDLFLGCPNSEDAAGILGAAFLWVEIVGQPAVASGHLLAPCCCSD
jgi:hypothetical protein